MCNHKHRLNRWYAQGIEGHNTGRSLKISERFANRIIFTGRR
ncbi:hypothetical protein EVA_19771 [gut metagenome]|uniref:Uncharacterized protein n=1 Tax=gut metagenome TaxID=749906 RepID=J9FB51_9ZZZZ